MAWLYLVKVELPDEYDEEDLALTLERLAERVRENADPICGEIWDRKGRLLARTEVVEQ